MEPIPSTVTQLSYWTTQVTELYAEYSTKPQLFLNVIPDSKVHGANMGPTWDLSVTQTVYQYTHRNGIGRFEEVRILNA